MRISVHAKQRLRERGGESLIAEDELAAATPFGTPHGAKSYLRLPCGLIAVVKDREIGGVVVTVLRRRHVVKMMKEVAKQKRAVAKAEKQQYGWWTRGANDGG